MKNPYRALASRIMLQATEDAGLVNGKPCSDLHGKALAWIFLDPKEPFYAYSFRGCCDLMNLRTTTFRERLRNRLSPSQEVMLAELKITRNNARLTQPCGP
jgi:hypothetical protein